MQNCPICFEVIGDLNRVVTECGHVFHTKCLMTNVTFNGFGCPYCRTAMAEEVDEDEEEDEEYEDDDYALRGFRMFYNNIEDQPHEQEDLEEEIDFMATTVAKPTLAVIVEKLTEQGFTMEDFVKAMLKDVADYESEEQEFNRLDGEIFYKITKIITDFQTEALS